MAATSRSGFSGSDRPGRCLGSHPVCALCFCPEGGGSLEGGGQRKDPAGWAWFCSSQNRHHHLVTDACTGPSFQMRPGEFNSLLWGHTTPVCCPRVKNVCQRLTAVIALQHSHMAFGGPSGPSVAGAEEQETGLWGHVRPCQRAGVWSKSQELEWETSGGRGNQVPFQCLWGHSGV